MNTVAHNTAFAPILYLKNVAEGVEYYRNAFDAKALREWKNEDGTLHVAEMSIGSAIFHLHEETPRNSELSPETLGGTPIVLGLFVTDPDGIMARALAAGAIETHPMQDYDYGYRQGSIVDPFEHRWVIQKAL